MGTARGAAGMRHRSVRKDADAAQLPEWAGTGGARAHTPEPLGYFPASGCPHLQLDLLWQVLYGDEGCWDNEVFTSWE